jgi:uncharacterized membrane protein
MDWLQFGAQWLHVLLGITWFGSAIAANFIFIPALMRMPMAQQQSMAAAYGEAAGRLLTMAGAGVIVLGFLRGTVLGPIKSLDMLGSQYGITWLVALVAAIATFAWGKKVLEPAIKRLNSVDPSRAVLADGSLAPELVAAIADVKLKAMLELLGFLVIFTCMILMRFGL